MELPLGAQDTKQGEAAMRVVHPLPQPVLDVSGAPVQTFTATTSGPTPQAPTPQPPEVKPPLPNLNKTFILDPLL